MSDFAASPFDPYHKWLGIPASEQPPNHYRLLGITVLESDADVIENAADRQMSHLRSFQIGKNSAASQKLLNEVAAARGVLLNPAKKEVYDRQFKVDHADARPAEESPAEPPLPRMASVAPVQVSPVPVALPRPAVRPTPLRELEALQRVVIRSASPPAPQRKASDSKAIPLAVAALVAAVALIVLILKLRTGDGDSFVAHVDRAPVTGGSTETKPTVVVAHEAQGVAKNHPAPSAAEMPAKPPLAAPQQAAPTIANVDPAPAAAVSPEKTSAAVATAENQQAAAIEQAAAIQQAAIARWEKEVAALGVSQQLEAVMAKLRELNPGLDGQLAHKIEADAVVELRIATDNVTDITPLRALRQLKVLNCSGSGDGKSRLSDLSPLKGLKLTNLNCRGTLVVDLSPLKGMPLTHLDCNMTKIADLSPLAGMPLVELFFWGAAVSDLSPLKGMSVANLNCGGTPVSDLSPLRNTPLTGLDLGGAGNLTDSSPLRDTPLVGLSCYNTRVADLSPLAGLPLTYLNCANTPVTDISSLERCSKLQHLQLQGTKVPAAAVAGLRKQLPNCEIGDP